MTSETDNNVEAAVERLREKRSVKNRDLSPFIKDVEQQARFWVLVARGGEDECWEWTAGKNDSGYGVICWKGRTFTTHRVSWAIAHGQPPNGMCICHRCDNRRCCNPAHLFVGTVADNNRDMRLKGRATYLSGAKHRSARLTPEQVADIRSGRMSQRKFADLYGVSQMTVWLAQKGKTWATEHRGHSHEQ